MRESTLAWLEKAKADLMAARILLDSGQVTSIAAFHCQQCVEKALKAVLEEFRQAVPRSHDLGRLYSLASAHIHLDLDSESLHMLSSVYIETRYPSDIGLLPSGQPSLAIVNRFHAFAVQSLQQIQSLLSGN